MLVDDNDVTITGHPSQYFSGYSVQKTLEGHGMTCAEVNPEGPIADLYAAIRTAVLANGPYAVICKRKMCPGIEGVEGSNHGHDAVAVAKAVPYLEARGHTEAVAYLKSVVKTTDPSNYTYATAPLPPPSLPLLGLYAKRRCNSSSSWCVRKAQTSIPCVKRAARC